MRSHRILAVLVVVALATLTTLTSTTATAAQQAKPRHVGAVHGKEIGNTNKFVAYGHWDTFKGRRIAIQRKNCGTCAWKGYKKVKTRKSDGHFRTRIERGDKVPSRVCYRVNVPPTKKYKRTIAFVGCIQTKRV